jgi:hypothetical protein
VQCLHRFILLSCFYLLSADPVEIYDRKIRITIHSCWRVTTCWYGAVMAVDSCAARELPTVKRDPLLRQLVNLCGTTTTVYLESLSHDSWSTCMELPNHDCPFRVPLPRQLVNLCGTTVRLYLELSLSHGSTLWNYHDCLFRVPLPWQLVNLWNYHDCLFRDPLPRQPVNLCRTTTTVYLESLSHDSWYTWMELPRLSI